MATFFESLSPAVPQRKLSHAHSVAVAGGIEAWNQSHPDVQKLGQMLASMCRATNVEEALKEVSALMSLEHNLWTYAYMRPLLAEEGSKSEMWEYLGSINLGPS